MCSFGAGALAGQPIDAPKGSPRFILPSFNDTPESTVRNNEFFKALEERREGKNNEANQRLERIGIRPSAPNPQDPSPVEKYQQKLQQQKQQFEQQKQYELEQQKAAEELRKQQLQQYLFDAIRKGYRSWVEYALKNGANVHDSYGGYTPVQYAVAARHLDVAQYLIEQGGDIGTKENMYYMLLHQAAYANNLELAKLVLSKGANPGVEDKSGKQAWEYARSGQMKSLLMTAGGRQDVVPGASGHTPASGAQIPPESPFAPEEKAPSAKQDKPAQ